MIYRHILLCALPVRLGVLLLLLLLYLFFFGLQNSIRLGTNGRVLIISKKSKVLEICALGTRERTLLFLRHLLVYIFTWARVPLRGKFNIELRKHTPYSE